MSKHSFESLKRLLAAENDPLEYRMECLALMGFVRFLLGYYAVLVTSASKCAKIGENIIYRIDEVAHLTTYVAYENPLLERENKYFMVYKNFDIQNQMYFSKTYNLTKTLQENFIIPIKNNFKKNFRDNLISPNKKKEEKKVIKQYASVHFLWNFHHIKDFFEIVNNTKWCIFCIYGFLGQTGILLISM